MSITTDLWIMGKVIFYSDKQTSLEKIREKLAAQMKTRVDDEDDRIRKAVEEAEEKRAKDDVEREKKARRMVQEASEHRVTMVINSLLNTKDTFPYKLGAPLQIKLRKGWMVQAIPVNKIQRLRTLSFGTK